MAKNQYLPLNGSKPKHQENQCSICGRKVNPGVGICNQCIENQDAREPKMGEFWDD